MPTYTLLTLRNLAEHASGEVIAPDKRQTPTLVNALLNESLAQYYLQLTDCGHPHATTRAELTTSSSTTVTTGWPANTFVALPTDFMALLAIRIQTTAGAWRTMQPYSESSDDHDGWFWAGQETAMPTEYRIGSNTSGAPILRLRMPADAAYTIEIVYVPTPAELTESGTAVLLPGTADWVVCDVALKMLESIGVPEANQAQALMARKQAADVALRTYAGRRDRAGTVGMRDTRSARALNRSATLWR
jgi:hypothetical protein